MRKIQRELAELPSQLRKLLEGDAEVQHETLGAVRAKMKDYEYSAHSVPFELFQNADDAAAELADMLVGSTAEALKRVVFSLDDQNLTLVHWGCPINEFCRGDFSADEGRRRGYDKDLKKMLILSASDKGQRAELVTGKFGLGFKSVFFLTDRPQVLSGALAFEVLGGFFPRRASPETVRVLVEAPPLYGPPAGEATVINLPLRSDRGNLAEEALRAFGELLPISLIFSRQIKDCVLSLGGDAAAVRLVERRVGACPLASVCGVASDSGLTSMASERFLVLSVDRSGSVVLGLGPEGFRKIPDPVPTFWVTTPTKTMRNAGVAVHGGFAVDVGRNQLAESEDNETLARTMGASIGGTLVELFDAAVQWNRFRDELDLANDLRPEELWLSLWDLLSRDCVRADPILRAILFSPRAGLMKLIAERAALPTALPVPFDGLTQLGEIRAEVSGILDYDDVSLAAVLSWPRLHQAWARGHLVSRKCVTAILRESLADSTVPWTQFTLLEAVQAEVGDAIEVEPEAAERLGVVLHRKALQGWEHQRQHAEEVERIRAFLGTLRFRTVDGGCSAPGDLVARQLGGDEARRAAFAPAERRLHPAYTGNATEFFLACRSERSAPVIALADWAMTAESEDSRVAVLRYLLEGDLRRHLAQQLQSQDGYSWLRDIPDSCLARFSGQEQLQIRAMLGLGYDELRAEVYEEFMESFGPGPPPQSYHAMTPAA